MNNVVVVCPVCKKFGSEFASTLNQKGNTNVLDLEIRRCLQCGHVFLGDYGQDYSQDLYSYYTRFKGKSPETLYDPLTQASYRQVLDLIAKYSRRYARILDVGCGKGDFVYAAKQNGYEVLGIDLSLPAVDICRAFGLPVCALDFFSDEIKPESYDAITMFEVLEHLSSPVDFVRRAESVLKPGGVLYLTTPNYDSLDRLILRNKWRVFHKEHINYFTTKILSTLVCENTSLEIRELQTRNISSELIIKLLSALRPKASIANESHMENGNLDAHGSPDIRISISKSKLLSKLKTIANRALRFTGAGSTIIAMLKKPH